MTTKRFLSLLGACTLALSVGASAGWFLAPHTDYWPSPPSTYLHLQHSHTASCTDTVVIERDGIEIRRLDGHCYCRVYTGPPND